ncbi:MAG TPA: chloride channel protein [Polyangiaceae bacterium]|nr:chloride channel protein [Polyangiaceae bacterium]
MYALRLELRLAPTEPQRLFILTILIGGLCGLAAVAFRGAIFFFSARLIDRALTAPGWKWIPWTLATPALGALAAGLLLQFVVPGARGSGIPQVKTAFASRAGKVPLRDAVGKFVIGSLQIATGGSLGLEGPTVQICAGVASALGRVVQLSPQSRRRLIPVGAAAGIAAAFNAPIAAVTFTIEEVVGQLDHTVLSGVIVAAALAAVIERSVLGENPVLASPQHYTLTDPRSLLLYAALGVAAAVAAVAFTDGLLKVRARFRAMRRVPLWAQPAIGGAATGVVAIGVMAWLRIGGITGGGYRVLDQALMGQLAAKVMIVLCAGKLVATVFSYSSGGAGGIFAPSLFIGAMLGGAFGSLDRLLFHHDDVGAFALVGMGAVFSASIRVPITSVLIIVEMTSGYSLILPLMIANMSAYVIARRWRPEPIYEALLAQDGVHLRNRAVLDTLEVLKLDSLLASGTPFISFTQKTVPSEIVRRVAANTHQFVFPVVDDEQKLIGVVTTDEIAVLQAEPELELLINASDLMRNPIAVRAHDDLRTVFELMRAEGLREIPVLDEEGIVLGLVGEREVAQAYLEATAGKPAHSTPPPHA